MLRIYIIGVCILMIAIIANVIIGKVVLVLGMILDLNFLKEVL